MDFLRLMNLRLRELAFRSYHFVGPLVSKTRVTKIRLGKKTLGQRMEVLFYKALHFKVPEPIEAEGLIMYHCSPDKRGWFGWLYAFNYEPETRRVFEEIVRPGMTVVDIGANIGYYSLLAAKLVGDRGKVYAFEPDPAYYTLLKKNTAINRLNGIIEPFNIAIGDREKKSILYLGQSTGTSFFKIKDITGQKVNVDVLPLDRFFAEKNWPRVDVIKIDIEGAEKIALEGMHDLIKRNPWLKVIIELNSAFLEIAGTSPEGLLTLLSELGFNLIQVLYKDRKLYEIPQDIKNLAEIGRKAMFINLLCKKNI